MQGGFGNYFVFWFILLFEIISLFLVLNYMEEWRETFLQVEPSCPDVWPCSWTINSTAGAHSCLPEHSSNNSTSSLKLSAWSSLLPHPNVCNKGNSQLGKGVPCLPTDGYLLINSHPPSTLKGVINWPASPREQRTAGELKVNHQVMAGFESQSSSNWNFSVIYSSGM